MKVEINRDVMSDKVTVTGTPEQEEIRVLQYQVKDALVHLLAKQFIDEHGHEILDSLDPEVIAEEVKKNIARKLL